MAVYDPNLNWLRDQLKSLNDQNYPHLRLYIVDDCSPTVSFDDIKNVVSKCITRINFSITKNESNLGSNKTFEALTDIAEGEFFAYCDQDDIWIPEKLSILYDKIINTEALLVSSDMSVIDADGRITAKSIKQVRRHQEVYSGYNLLPRLLVSKCVAGCTMLIRSSIARSAVPFCPYMVHDQYLALFCSNKGLIITLKEQLIYYRIHNNNQTHVLAGVTDKRSYYEKRILLSKQKFTWLKDNFICDGCNQIYLLKSMQWANAREFWYHKKNIKNFYQLWVLRDIKFSETMFELVSLLLPNFLFRFLIWLCKRNLL